MKAPTHTPWGPPDSTLKVAEGIAIYSTPGHGGTWLSPERVGQLPDWARNAATWLFRQGEDPARQWYEEDCDWCIPVLAFPAEFRTFWVSRGASTVNINTTMAQAEECLRLCHPERWTAYKDRLAIAVEPQS